MTRRKEKRLRHSARSIVSLIMGISLLVVLAVGCSSKAPTNTSNPDQSAFGEYTAQKPLVLKLATQDGEKNIKAVGLKKLCAALEEKSKGVIKTEAYFNATMGSEREILETTISGGLDGGTANASVMANWVDLYNVLAMSYLFESNEVANKFSTSKLGQEMADMMSVHGITLTGWTNLGFRSLNGKKPIYNIDDIKGVKIRTIENDMIIRSMKAWGANPVALPQPELLTALQQGTVDFQEQTPVLTYDNKFHEIVKYFSQTEQTAQLYGFFYNKKKLDSLPPDLKKLIIDTSREVMLELNHYTEGLNKEALDKMAKEGAIVITKDQIDIESFKAGLQDVWAYAEEKYGKDTIEQFKAFNKQ